MDNGGNYPVNNGPAVDPTSTQMNPAYCQWSYLITIHLNIIHPSMNRLFIGLRTATTGGFLWRR
jgi:hypothetical protein